MVKVAVLVPYRACRLQNRAHHLTIFLDTMPTILDAAIGPGNWAIIVVEQSADGFKFSRGRCLNAAARLAATLYPDAHFVLHDVDLIPDVDRAKAYASDPPLGGVLALNADSKKYETCIEYIGGICSVSRATFERVNGFQNTFQGWGGEDDCFRDAVKAHTTCAEWLVCCREGKVRDLEDEDDPELFKRACTVPEFKCEKYERRALRASARAARYSDGYHELAFEVSRVTKFADIHDAISLYTCNLFVSLEGGWKMAVSKTKRVPFYYHLVTGAKQFSFPGVRTTSAAPIQTTSRKRSAPGSDLGSFLE